LHNEFLKSDQVFSKKHWEILPGWMPIGACPGTETVPELAGETPAPLDVAEGRARFMVIKVILRGFLMIFGFGHGVWSQGLRQAGNHS
jgi:hypothetical protein